jgi:hypothetical protein
MIGADQRPGLRVKPKVKVKPDKYLKKLLRFLGSLKLAVFVILSLAAIAAIGTVFEANYNAETAQKLVYHSNYMKFVIGLLVVNLVFSALERWPWKKRHTGFIVAHVGLLTIILGSLITNLKGVDGSMVFGIGESNRYISVNENELLVYVTGDDLIYHLLYRKPVDFLVDDPKKYPVEFKFGEDTLCASDFYPYAVQKQEVGPATDEKALPALRFQLFNDRVNLTEWLQQSSNGKAAVMPLGPATLILTDGDYKPTGDNEMVMKPIKGDPKYQVQYFVYSKNKKGLINSGKLKIGDLINTGWMTLQFRLLNYYPKAILKTQFKSVETPTELTTSAVQIDFNGTKHWVGQNGTLKLFGKNQGFVVSYGDRRLDTGFNMKLKSFEVGHYQGTARAATYESVVDVEGRGEVKISMNEPLVQNGYTFYQASFQDDGSGHPTASILAVNYDPGRWFKYIGAILVVAGAILMFYMGGYFKPPSKL